MVYSESRPSGQSPTMSSTAGARSLERPYLWKVGLGLRFDRRARGRAGRRRGQLICYEILLFVYQFVDSGDLRAVPLGTYLAPGGPHTGSFAPRDRRGVSWWRRPSPSLYLWFFTYPAISYPQSPCFVIAPSKLEALEEANFRVVDQGI